MEAYINRNQVFLRTKKNAELLQHKILHYLVDDIVPQAEDRLLLKKKKVNALETVFNQFYAERWGFEDHDF